VLRKEGSGAISFCTEDGVFKGAKRVSSAGQMRWEESSVEKRDREFGYKSSEGQAVNEFRRRGMIWENYRENAASGGKIAV